LTLELQIHSPNTGAATININGLGAINLEKDNGQPLAANDLLANTYYVFICTGSTFKLFRNPAATNNTNGSVNLTQTARAWVVFNGVTGVLERGYNISSVIRNSVGNYTIPLDITSASALYVIQVSCLGPLVGAPDGGTSQIVTVTANNNFTIEFVDRNAIPRDANQVYVCVFGDDFT